MIITHTRTTTIITITTTTITTTAITTCTSTITPTPPLAATMSGFRRPFEVLTCGSVTTDHWSEAIASATSFTTRSWRNIRPPCVRQHCWMV
ncbi:unnamed protein product [Parnassius mnemosyne]|uniref:Secreted protein n=1 Tax=Parnassius mnemosyne TaxID=213953 RepID=A0AAV1M296_9NEOP